jgi:putative transposase
MREGTSKPALEASQAAPGILVAVGLSLECLIRREARDLIQQAVEVEVAEMLAGFAPVRLLDGRRVMVRNGHLPAREILTGVGPVAVAVPQVRDRSGNGITL